MIVAWSIQVRIRNCGVGFFMWKTKILLEALFLNFECMYMRTLYKFECYTKEAENLSVYIPTYSELTMERKRKDYYNQVIPLPALLIPLLIFLYGGITRIKWYAYFYTQHTPKFTLLYLSPEAYTARWNSSRNTKIELHQTLN